MNVVNVANVANVVNVANVANVANVCPSIITLNHIDHIKITLTTFIFLIPSTIRLAGVLRQTARAPERAQPD